MAMYLGLRLIGMTAAVWVITPPPTRPAIGTLRPRDLERRGAQLHACPGRVTQADLDRVLRAHPLAEPTIARVLGRAARRGIGTRTMWAWADRFGVDKLVLALDADVADARLRRHLEAGSTPDWEAMSVFARLNNDTPPGGMPFEEIIDLDSVPQLDDLSFDLSEWETPEMTPVATSDVDLSQFDHLPPVYDPDSPVIRSVAPPVDRSRGDKGWPQVA
jgi:hypothetical protein